jgi:prolyl oligopeptidase
MKKLFLLFLAVSVVACSQQQEIKYPKPHKGKVVDNYFGTKVADPYRWMEDVNSPETKKWVEEENRLTESYLSKIPFRNKIKKSLTELFNYERFSAPAKHGEYYFFSKNDGLQNYSVVYYQKGLTGKPEVFLDPNTFSNDASVSLAGLTFSHNTKYAAYSISKGGSDWRDVFVMDVASRKKLGDHLAWVKFSGMAWFKDGFFYSRYDKPKKGEALKAQNEFQKLYYHKVGTSQNKDVLVMQDKKNPRRGWDASVTDDEKYLVIAGWEGSSDYNLLYYKDLSKKQSKIISLINKLEAQYSVIDNIGSKLLVETNFDAPNYKVVLIDTKRPAKKYWKTVIPETENPIRSVSFVDNKLIVSYLKDANTKVYLFDINGKQIAEVKLPGIGTASGFNGEKTDKEVFYTFTSFTYPPTIYKYNVEKNKSEVFRKSNVKFNPNDYETKQVFYKSKDGTKVPLFITYKKGLKLDGNNPTLLYAYGGFNISLTPRFSVTRIPLLENGGVYAMANIRGGGEYGEKWHKAAMKEKRQNAYDDFIAAGEYLIKAGYTSHEKLAIMGGSNGGLLMGVIINQRPDLAKVAFPMVGVMDLLRFQKFTIGWAWVPEYGSSDNEAEFKYLYKISPLHNLKKGVKYPATLVTTADHDDRVFPAHSFKYAATLQEDNGGDNPTLIRIETKVGHGAGTNVKKTISLYTDIYSFMFYNMGIEPKD